MKIKRIDTYKKHGCDFVGNLGIIDYTEHWKSQRGYGKFGSMSIFDALDDAKELMEKEYPSAVILIGVPDLVFRIG